MFLLTSCLARGIGAEMKLIAEYVADAVKFKQLAELEKNPEVKALLEKQAAAYRHLAEKRAKDRGIPPSEIPH
jgi:hypothetical protein